MAWARVFNLQSLKDLLGNVRYFLESIGLRCDTEESFNLDFLAFVQACTGDHVIRDPSLILRDFIGNELLEGILKGTLEGILEATLELQKEH